MTNYRARTSFSRILALTLIAGLLSGCGASSVISPASDTQTLGMHASTPLKPQLGRTNEQGSNKYRVSARKAAQKLTSVSKPGSTAYKIGPQDVLDISVFKVAELSKTVQVSDTGTINLPLVGETPTAGKTAREIERDLTKKWGAKYLQSPQVTVFVKEYNSQRITVEGAVKKPGVFPIKGRMTLLQAIATAQGLDETSSSTVIVFREKQGKRAAAKFEITDIRNGNAVDPKLKAGDVVIVGKSAMKATFNTMLKVLRFTSVFALL